MPPSLLILDGFSHLSKETSFARAATTKYHGCVIKQQLPISPQFCGLEVQIKVPAVLYVSSARVFEHLVPNWKIVESAGGLAHRRKWGTGDGP